MSERSSIFDDPLDVAGFKPKKGGEGRGPAPEEIDAVSQPKFRSREPTGGPPDTVIQPSTRRPPMVYRTGRNTTLSVKTTPATVDRFYEIARQKGWKAGETFEQAVEALERELAQEAKP